MQPLLFCTVAHAYHCACSGGMHTLYALAVTRQCVWMCMYRNRSQAEDLWFQHCSKIVISFVLNQVGFLIYEHLFQKCSCEKCSHVRSSHTFRLLLCAGWVKGFWHRKLWRTVIQGCLFYFCFNIKMQFNPLTCCSFWRWCSKDPPFSPFFLFVVHVA